MFRYTESAIVSSSSQAPFATVQTKRIFKKFKKIWIFLATNIDIFFACVQNIMTKWHSCRSWQKNKIDAPKCFQKQFFFGAWFCFFCWHLHKCHFITKIGTHVEKISISFFYYFSDFTVHPGSLVLGITCSMSQEISTKTYILERREYDISTVCSL